MDVDQSQEESKSMPEDDDADADADVDVDIDKMNRNRWAYARKARPLEMQNPDESFDHLQKIRCEGHDRHEWHLGIPYEPTGNPYADYSAIPPNQLYFEMILEAYVGYKLYTPVDPDLPRPAIMGGCIVAALTAFRDETVVRVFKAYEQVLHNCLTGNCGNASDYLHLKGKILNKLADPEEKLLDAFQDGDVDIFLQSSPLTHSLIEGLERSLDYNVDALQHIMSFMGGHNRDLKAYTDKLVDNIEKGIDTDEWGFAFAVAHNTCTFALANRRTNPKEDEILDMDVCPSRWPRVTQCIILDNRADLFDALLDFDISCCACAYDGVNVVATPRAVLSLELLTCMITPFCLQEKRSKFVFSKSIKSPGVFQCIQSFFLTFSSFIFAIFSMGLQTKSVSLSTTNVGLSHISLIHIVPMMHQAKFLVLTSRNKKERCCCNYGRRQESEDYVERFNVARMIDYTIAMFEKRKGDALSYFAKRYKWSARDREDVSKIDEKYRVACTGCRNDYALQLVFKKLPPEIQDVEESVKCEFAYQNSEGYTNHFRPSFYFGGVFDSTKKMGTARSMIGLLNMLRGQYRAEVARYILKHDCTIEGYQRRFTFSETTKIAFYLASNIIFPKPSRPPIGLNPERIVGTCEAKGC